MTATLVVATEHLDELESAEIVHATVNRPCALRCVMPSHESNPITAIARTRGVARWDDYKHIHVPEPVSFGFVVIHHLIRLPQHAIVTKMTAIFD